jgi:hypothetical protein
MVGVLTKRRQCLGMEKIASTLVTFGANILHKMADVRVATNVRDPHVIVN